MIPTIFIGYDAREHEAAQVAAFSIRRRATCHVKIYPLEHRTLRRLGLFNRPWVIDSEGQMFDDRDGKPFSTEFSHSRFLVFALAMRLKLTAPCVFVDCDWHFLSDINNLMTAQKAHGDLIGVVNRTRTVHEGSMKMDGMVQQNYHRKLWSALFTFMPSKVLADRFTMEAVNDYSGRDLHGFLGMADNLFWDIDPAWHFIPTLDERPNTIKGVHYSEFSPWLNDRDQVQADDLCDLWYDERQALLESLADRPEQRLFDNLEADLMGVPC